MTDLKNLAIIGNVLFIAWLFMNGANEGFKATPAQFASYVGLTFLLGLNIYLLHHKK